MAYTSWDGAHHEGDPPEGWYEDFTHRWWPAGRGPGPVPGRRIDAAPPTPAPAPAPGSSSTASAALLVPAPPPPVASPAPDPGPGLAPIPSVAEGWVGIDDRQDQGTVIAHELDGDLDRQDDLVEAEEDAVPDDAFPADGWVDHDGDDPEEEVLEGEGQADELGVKGNVLLGVAIAVLITVVSVMALTLTDDGSDAGLGPADEPAAAL